MNKRLFVYVGVSVAVAIAFNIVSNGMFPYEANFSEAKDACDSGAFDGIASPLEPGQMRAEDCFTLGVLYMASISAWLASSAAIATAGSFLIVYMIRAFNTKKPSV